MKRLSNTDQRTNKLENVPSPVNDTDASNKAYVDSQDTSVASTAQSNLTAHTGNTSNPHSVTKAQVGLGNVDNTSDLDKPVSTATQTALDAKANSSDTVNLTGDQTIAGVKTFSSSPIVPTATTTTQAVNKAQMDTADALKYNKTGGTISGQVVVNNELTNPFIVRATPTTSYADFSYENLRENTGGSSQMNMIYTARLSDGRSSRIFTEQRQFLNRTAGSQTSLLALIGRHNGVEAERFQVLGNRVIAGGASYPGIFQIGTNGPQWVSGTGSPNGVVSAPVGSTYTDTNATNGAIEWEKATGAGNTGWVVSVGDTGWRNINSLLSSFWQSGVGAFAVRRIGSTVFVRVDGVRVAASPTGSRLSARSLTNNTWPAGFKQNAWGTYLSNAYIAGYPGTVVPMDDTSDLGVNVYNAGLSSTGNWTLDDYISFQYQYATNDAWPTTLPGA